MGVALGAGTRGCALASAGVGLGGGVATVLVGALGLADGAVFGLGFALGFGDCDPPWAFGVFGFDLGCSLDVGVSCCMCVG